MHGMQCMAGLQSLVCLCSADTCAAVCVWLVEARAGLSRAQHALCVSGLPSLAVIRLGLQMHGCPGACVCAWRIQHRGRDAQLPCACVCVANATPRAQRGGGFWAMFLSSCHRARCAAKLCNGLRCMLVRVLLCGCQRLSVSREGRGEKAGRGETASPPPRHATADAGLRQCEEGWGLLCVVRVLSGLFRSREARECM
jgi:hypothetical protein